MTEKLSDYLKTADATEFLGVSQNTLATANPCVECMMVPFWIYLRADLRRPSNLAHLKRYFRSLKEEYLEQLILLGKSSLRKAVKQFVEHHHTEKNHQGLDNTLIETREKIGTATGNVRCRERLGGLLHY